MADGSLASSGIRTFELALWPVEGGGAFNFCKQPHAKALHPYLELAGGCSLHSLLAEATSDPQFPGLNSGAQRGLNETSEFCFDTGFGDFEMESEQESHADADLSRERMVPRQPSHAPYRGSVRGGFR